MVIFILRRKEISINTQFYWSGISDIFLITEAYNCSPAEEKVCATIQHVVQIYKSVNLCVWKAQNFFKICTKMPMKYPQSKVPLL